MCKSECDSDVMVAPADTSIMALPPFGELECVLCLVCVCVCVSVVCVPGSESYLPNLQASSLRQAILTLD